MNTTTRTAYLKTGLVPLTTIPEEPECAVCTDEYVDPVELRGCKHTFCKWIRRQVSRLRRHRANRGPGRACIVQWLSLRSKNTCPSCRDVLFALDDADRGPVGHDRIVVMQQALTNSRLLTGEFQVFNDDIAWAVSDIQRATASANFWLSEQNHSNAAGPALINVDRLGHHLVAMGNLITGYAQAMRRPYCRNQIRDWRFIVNALYNVLDAKDGVKMDAMVMPRELKQEIRVHLIEEGLTVDRFFEDEAESESLSGDVDVLLQYICNKAAEEFQRKERQARAVRNEPTVLGKVTLWAQHYWQS